MDLPVLLPKELSILESLKEEKKIREYLFKSSFLTTLFMDHALRDIAWSIENIQFLKALFEKVTNKFYRGITPVQAVVKLKKILYSAPEILDKIISFDITLQYQKELFQTNSLLFATSSDFFYDYFRLHCLDQKKKSIPLEENITNLPIILEYVHRGVIEDLWKWEEEDLLDLIFKAAELKINRLVQQVTEIYYRYLTVSSVKKLLKESLEKRIPELTHICIKFINAREKTFFLYKKGASHLGFGFIELHERTDDFFHEFQNYITDLSFNQMKLEKEELFKYIHQIKQLEGLDLSEFTPLSIDISQLPKTILMLNLSMASWLTPQIFEQITKACPRIRELKLMHNTHFNLNFWNLFSKLLELDHLNLSRCRQITDEDIKLIVRNIESLLFLELEGCNKLTDSSIIEIAKKYKQLLSIDLSGTNITDRSLVEIGFHCPYLETIKIKKCRNVTDLGVAQLKKSCRKLKSLEI